MNLKIALFGATALGMLMATGVVYAGDNNTLLIDQYGSNNTATTDQTNAHNSTIGDPATASYAGQGQLGGNTANNSSMSITQVGGYNSAGVGTYDGIFQEDSSNYLSIYQGYGLPSNYDPHNSVNEVHQFGYTGGYPGFYVNQASVTQYYDDHIGSIDQWFLGSGGPNVVTINQQGSGNGGDNVSLVQQTGHDNALNLQMSNPGYGPNNGVGNFTSGEIAAIVANPVSYVPPGLLPPDFQPVLQGSVVQVGSNNSNSFTVNGGGNLFGFEQRGQSNYITGSIAAGFADEIAVVQDGTGVNSLNANLSGAYNKLGVFQVGGSNTGYANLSGTDNQGALIQVGNGGANTGSVQTGASSDDNNVGVLQYASGGWNNGSASANGSNNIAGVVQYASSGSNTGAVSVTSGSGNVAVLGQYAAGGTNNASVTVGGNNNNALVGSSPAPFNLTSSAAVNDLYHVNSGNETIGNEADALSGESNFLGNTLGALGTQIGGHNLLTPGLTTQLATSGGSNGLTVNVSGNGNLFSTFQLASSGGTNSLNSSVLGDDNELAVAQVTSGGSNSATTSQNGTGNSIGLVQSGTNSASISQ